MAALRRTSPTRLIAKAVSTGGTEQAPETHHGTFPDTYADPYAGLTGLARRRAVLAHRVVAASLRRAAGYVCRVHALRGVA